MHGRAINIIHNENAVMMTFLIILLTMSINNLDAGWFSDNTAHAQQHNINLRADVHGTSITFSWNDVSRVGTVSHYALILDSRSVEIQVGSDLTRHVVDDMYGKPQDRLTWVIEARDTDREDGVIVVARDSVTITIPTNVAPVAHAGQDKIVKSFAEGVVLDGRRSSDGNGDYLSYAWTTPNGTRIQDRFTATPTLDVLPATTTESLVFEFLLTVSDGELTSTDTVYVTVRSSKPVADAGPDFVVSTEDTIVLDAKRSADPDGSELSYLWEQISGPDVEFTNDTQRTTFDAPSDPTTYRFKLSVSDGEHADSDFVTVRVVDSRPPVAEIQLPPSPAVGQRVMLNASASTDPDGDRLSYRWAHVRGENGESVSLSGSRSTVASFTAAERHVGSPLEFVVTVSDGSFESQAYATLHVGENHPPTAYIDGRITNPVDPDFAFGLRSETGARYTIPPGVTFTLDGSGSADPNSDPLTYVWVQTSGERVSLSGARTEMASFNTHRIEVATILEFQLTVRDVLRQTDTATVSIFVEGLESVGADAGADREAVAGSTISLDGSGSYGYYGDVSYSWTQKSGPSVSLEHRNTAYPRFTVPNAVGDVMVFELTVQDTGVVDTDTVSVFIGEDVDRTMANAGANTRASSGDTVSLDGGASTSASGDLTYNWRQIGSGPRVSLSDADAATASFTAPDASRLTTLTFRLTVTDEAGGTDSDTVSVVVGTNRPPSADAGNNMRVTEGTLVRLSGSGTDPERDRLTYQWSEQHHDVVLTNPSSSRPTFTAPEVDGSNEILLTLTVFDSVGNWARDQVTVLVVDSDAETTQTVLADAGTDQRVYPNSTVQLDGSGSIGSNLEYNWIKSIGPGVTLLPNDSVASPSFVAPSDTATIVFRLTVTSDGLMDVDVVTISIVSRDNVPPTADAGNDRTVTPGTVVTLRGDGTDPEGDNVNFRWDQTSGQTVIFTTAGGSIQFRAPDNAGTLTFKLTVTDDEGNAGSDTVNVMVVPQTRPIADAGTNIVAEPGDTVRLDGSGSYASDRSRLSYNWTQTGGLEVSLSGSTGSSPTFRAPQVASEYFTFMLTVTDRHGNNDTDTVEVHVKSIRPIANAGKDVTVKPGRTVTLYGSGGAGFGFPSFSWMQVSGHMLNMTGVPLDNDYLRFTAPDINGVLTFRLSVTNGILTATDTVRVTVDRNDPPTANAGRDRTAYTGDMLTFTGRASDVDGDVLTYRWTATGTPSMSIHDSDELTSRATAPNVSDTTTYTVTFTASDGINSTSDSLVLTVKPRVLPPPVVNRPPVAVAGDQLHVQSGDRVTLDGSKTRDPDGDRLTYRWTYDKCGDCPSISISSSGSQRASFTAPSGNHYNLVFRLTVSDGEYTDTAYQIVGVSDDNKPTVNAGSDRSASSNSTITLTGRVGNTDSDTRTFWEQTSGPSVYYIPANDDYTTVTINTPVVTEGSVQLVFRFVAFDSTWIVGDDVTITVRAR